MINKSDLQLSEDEQYELYKKLMEINDEKLAKLINKKFKRNRLINIYFIIRQFLRND